MGSGEEEASGDIPQVPEGAVGVRPILALPRVLSELGADPGRLFGAVGLDPAIFRTAGGFIPMPTVGQLVQRCVNETGCPHFGLLVTRQTKLSALGVIADLMKQCDTVGAALATLGRYLQLQDRGAELTIAIDGDTATLGYAVHVSNVAATDQIHDASIAIAVNILRALCGPFWRPGEAIFSRRPPADLRPYRDHFRCPLRFDAEQTAFRFPVQVLELPLWSVGTALDEGVRMRADELAERGGMTTRVRRLLAGLVLAPECSLELAAARLGLHRRTLNRRLEEEGTSFRTLMEEARFVRAQQLIANTDLSFGEIASTLNYSEASAFSRAFRRWAGVSPVHWRG